MCGMGVRVRCQIVLGCIVLARVGAFKSVPDLFARDTVFGFRSAAPTSRCNRLIEPDLDGSYTRKARLTNVSWKNSGVRRPARSAPDQGGASAQGLAEVANAKSVRAWSHLVRIQLFDLQSHEKRNTSRTDATNVASRYVRPKCSTRWDYHGSAALHPLRLA